MYIKVFFIDANVSAIRKCVMQIPVRSFTYLIINTLDGERWDQQERVERKMVRTYTILFWRYCELVSNCSISYYFVFFWGEIEVKHIYWLCYRDQW